MFVELIYNNTYINHEEFSIMGCFCPFVAACTPKAEQPTDSGLLRTNFQTEVGGKKPICTPFVTRTTWKFV